MDYILQLFMLAIPLGCGIYAAYAAIKLRIKGYLFESKFIYPGNCGPESCQDDEGFMAFIFPRLLIMAAIELIVAIVYGLGLCVISLPAWAMDWALPGVAFLALVWYVIAQGRAAKLYW